MSASECAREVLEAVPPVIWFMRREVRRRGGRLSLTQLRLLGMIDRCPAASLSDAAEHLGVSLPTASRIVAGLVRKRMLDRHPCSNDRRRMSLIVTTEGLGMLKSARGHAVAQMAPIMERLGPAQREQLVQAMGFLRELFTAAGGSITPVRVAGRPRAKAVASR